MLITKPFKYREENKKEYTEYLAVFDSDIISEKNAEAYIGDYCAFNFTGRLSKNKYVVIIEKEDYEKLERIIKRNYLVADKVTVVKILEQ